MNKTSNPTVTSEQFELGIRLEGILSSLAFRTGKRGKEQKQWVDQTVEQQIGAIVGKYGERLAGFLLFGKALQGVGYESYAARHSDLPDRRQHA